MAGVAVLDAGALIAFFESHDPVHAQAVDVVTSAIRRSDRLIANELTVAEFLVGPARAGNMESAEKRLAELGINRLDFPRRSRRGSRRSGTRPGSSSPTPRSC